MTLSLRRANSTTGACVRGAMLRAGSHSTARSRLVAR